VTPLDVFNPANLSDASRLTGPAGVRALLDAARSFPGGPAMLVFALFWSPVGPGIPAGVLLARHVPLSPPITFALYAASELLLLGALACYPLFTALRRHARRVRALHWIGTRMLRLAMLGTQAPRAAEVQAELRPARCQRRCKGADGTRVTASAPDDRWSYPRRAPVVL
jgi:hypothetical protein